MKPRIKVKRIHERFASEGRLGIYWMRSGWKEFEIGLDMAVFCAGLRFIRRENKIDPTETSEILEWELGTYLREGLEVWRYACAGEDLPALALLEPDLAGRIISEDDMPDAKEFNKLLYGNVKVIPFSGTPPDWFLGYPDVKVRRGRFFWIHLKEPCTPLILPQEGVSD
jgi:hypothetical protein